MLIDALLVMSDAQAVTSSAAGSYYVDALAAGDALNPGARIHVVVNTLFVTGDSATLTVALQTDDNASFSSATTLLTTSALAATALTAGAVLLSAVIPTRVERYLRVYYTVGTGTFSAGNVDARIVLDSHVDLDENR